MDVRLWVALDVPDEDGAERILTAIGPHRDVKVGMELFYRLGPDYVKNLADRGYRIFLDLKCHDIPRTVARAVEAVSVLGVEMLTIHAAGGFEMLNQARQAAGSLSLIAVTVLTSLDQAALEEVGILTTVDDLAESGARTAMRAGVAGLVCSAGELPLMRRVWPGSRLVVPGIRRPSDAAGDQRRVFTAADAARAGATDIVVGRPITQAQSPRAALEEFLQELAVSP